MPSGKRARFLRVNARLDLSVVLSLAVLLMTLSRTVVSSPVTVTCSHRTFSLRLHWCPFSCISCARSVPCPVGCLRASVVSGASARCACCGSSLVGSDASRCRVSAEDARGVMANSGSDHVDRNSRKHGPEASGGTKALSNGTGTMDGFSFVDTVVGRAALA